jgi:hypothetical protein
MTPEFQDDSVTLYHSDVLAALREMPDNSFDGCLTDPPYGLSSTEKRSPQRKSGVEQNKRGFMGLEWDGQVPGPPANVIHDGGDEVLECFPDAPAARACGGGRWSVDFCQDVHGKWWLPDMATAADSFHWPGCEFAGSV